MKQIPVLKVGLATVFASFVTHYAVADESKLLDPLFQCQNIQDLRQKTLCYDKAVAHLKETGKTGKIVVITAETLDRLGEETFGYELPPISLFKLGEDEPLTRKKMIRSDIANVQQFLTGYVFTLKNGQVWEQYSDDISHIPPGDLTAQIRLMNSGSYRMMVTNGKHRVKNIKVRRIS